MWATHRFNDRKVVAALIGALIGLAWLSLWVWGQSPYGRYLSHHALEEVRGDALLALVFLTGWTLMLVAMMLPTSLPVVLLFYAIVRQRAHRLQLLALLIAGYLAVWIGFGLVVYVGDGVVHAAVEASPWLEAHSWVVGSATLLAAGLYQFSALKYMCLDACRSPLSFVMSHWRGRRERRQALALGLRHGLFCLGCCWSLMLLMFAVGIGSLGWMLVLGAVMAIEKNTAWGRRLSAPLGLLLLGWGALSIFWSI